MSLLYVQQLTYEGEGWWGLRFGGPSLRFWELVEQLRAEKACWDPHLFAGRGGWLLEEEKLLHFADHFSDLVEHVQSLKPEHDQVRTLLSIPVSLRAECSLLHLPTRTSLTQVRKQYRKLAQLYHPDTGGHHTYFLALQRAYERMIEYLQSETQKTA
jgi:hypothetical protein